MKKLLLIATFVIAGLALTEGCKKEPEPKPATDMSKMAETAVANATEQTICPVMEGAIKKDLFVEYKGKKVYFCCPGCVDEFNKDPEKYIKDLPQFKQ